MANLENENEEIQDSYVVTMKDEDGNDVDFEMLDVIEYEGTEYAFLYPVDDAEAEGELVILKIEAIPGNDEEENYVSVESQELIDKLFEMFKEKHAEEFDFEN